MTDLEGLLLKYGGIIMWVKIDNDLFLGIS